MGNLRCRVHDFTGERTLDREFCLHKLAPSLAGEHRWRLAPAHQAGHSLVDALQSACGRSCS